jgi:hypothetical protein
MNHLSSTPISQHKELTSSQRLGPADGTYIAYDVNVPAGKKIRINVRDSVNPGFDGSALTDVLTIGEPSLSSSKEGQTDI